uniref:ATP synthase subunit a n=1 Tax=Panthalis oerstedi TaxID=318815 RepID=A0A343W6D6_9ANNE|nr:ATP synthase F0 subunit 6 [Panthalis oerstedi]
MMTDIFSSFDPASCASFTSISPLLFWSLSFTTLSMNQASLWLAQSRISWLHTFPMEMMSAQASRTFGLHLKGFPSILVPLFIMLIISNLFGLLPYVFSTTSHLFMTLAIGFPLWLSLILSGALHNPKSFSAHFLPSGAPDWLNPFLVVIESLSVLFRVITLSFRLTANMSAGHIILGLVGIYSSSAMLSSISTASCLLLIQLFYIVFEVGICLIQAYIFCLLLSLYSDDHPNN